MHKKTAFLFDNWYYVTSKWSSKILEKSFTTFIKMTITDLIKILDDKIKSNQEQYDLGREAAKIYVFLSKDLLEKYEYLTVEDLGHKTSVFEKLKPEYSSLSMTLINNTKNKTNEDKAYNKNKQNKYLVYHPQHSFAEFKDIDRFEECHLILCTKN